MVAGRRERAVSGFPFAAPALLHGDDARSHRLRGGGIGPHRPAEQDCGIQAGMIGHRLDEQSRAQTVTDACQKQTVFVYRRKSRDERAVCETLAQLCDQLSVGVSKHRAREACSVRLNAAGASSQVVDDHEAHTMRGEGACHAVDSGRRAWNLPVVGGQAPVRAAGDAEQPQGRQEVGDVFWRKGPGGDGSRPKTIWDDGHDQRKRVRHPFAPSLSEVDAQ